MGKLFNGKIYCAKCQKITDHVLEKEHGVVICKECYLMTFFE